jgi:hypothetical protein
MKRPFFSTLADLALVPIALAWIIANLLGLCEDQNARDTERDKRP